MRRMIFFASLMLCYGLCFGQDVIFTSASAEIKAKVLEINETTVKYKKFDYLDGPTFTIQKSEIAKIQYQNGTVDTFQTVFQNSQNESTTPTGTTRIYVQDTQNKQNETSVPVPTFVSRMEKSMTEQLQREEEKALKVKKYPDMKRFFIYAGATFPIGKCAKTMEGYTALFWESNDYDGYGGANIGFNFGIKGRIPVSKQLGVTISGDLILDGIKDDVFELEQEYRTDVDNRLNSEFEVNGYDYRLDTRSKYLNIPVLVGLNYTYLSSKGMGVSLEASLGADFDFITSTVFRNKMAGTCTRIDYYAGIQYYSAEKLKYTFVPAVHFAYRGSVAFVFGKRWSVGVEYLGTTKSSIKCDANEFSKEYGHGEGVRYYCGKLGFNMLMIRLGVGF